LILAPGDKVDIHLLDLADHVKDEQDIALEFIIA
jgi:hypothetical protein